jgi:hypothetical protein
LYLAFPQELQAQSLDKDMMWLAPPVAQFDLYVLIMYWDLDGCPALAWADVEWLLDCWCLTEVFVSCDDMIYLDHQIWHGCHSEFCLFIGQGGPC